MEVKMNMGLGKNITVSQVALAMRFTEVPVSARPEGVVKEISLVIEAMKDTALDSIRKYMDPSHFEVMSMARYLGYSVSIGTAESDSADYKVWCDLAAEGGVSIH